MAKSGIFASLNYKLNVQFLLLRISQENPKLQQMAKAVPASVYCHWRDTAHHEFPGIQTTSQHFAVSCSALLQFFQMSALEKAPMMLPSKAADSVWHTWMDHDKEGLQAFLKAHLNQDINHVEKARMSDPAKVMAATWRAAHDYHGNTQFSGELPVIFNADKITKIPGGFWYDRDPEDRRAAYYHDMDGKGAPDLVRKGTETLSWPKVYEEMSPARRAKADQEIVQDYEEPAINRNRHVAVLASLGLAAGTTAALYLSQQQIAQEEALERSRNADGGASYHASGPSMDGGDGSSCGSSCGG